MKDLHGRKIAFPEVKSLAELFDDILPHAHGDNVETVAEFPSWEAGTWSDRTGKTRCYLQGWMSVRRADGSYSSFHAKPRAEVIEHVRNHMLHGANDRIHFEVIEWADGKALVTAQYGQIIGSNYLAVIDASGIPSSR